MSDDLSLFDRRLRKQAAISLTGGAVLGVLAIQSQRISTGAETPWVMALVYGFLAAVALYAVSYRTLEKRLEHQS